MTTIVSLIGQQPIPNLLPIKYLQPEMAILVYSDFTQQAAQRLATLIKDQVVVQLLAVDAYSISDTPKTLLRLLSSDDYAGQEIIINLTGGTKAMSLAAYLVAAALKTEFLYLQSEGSQSRLYRYQFDDTGQAQLQTDQRLPPLISAADYLHAYTGSYTLTGFAKSEPGRSFEQAIHKALEPAVDELLVGARLLGALDVDFVVRCDNQVGIIEAKTGSGIKKGLDQLNTAGGQQYLGTYTRKFLVSNQVWDQSVSNLNELAQARQITVVAVPSYDQNGQISAEDKQTLRETICKALGRKTTS